jgi:hypothetical protein
MHPMARPGNNSGIMEKPGVYALRAGDRIISQDGRRGVADEFLQDGEAYVSFDDGTCACVRWQQISRESGPPPEVELREDLRWPQDFRYENGGYVRVREPWE